jgi:DNA-binding transcriptional LysR family regulator
LNIALELGSNEAIKEAVSKGVGVAVLSLLAVRKELESGQLHRLKINDLSLDRTLFVAWNKRRALPPPARIFRHFLQRYAAQ